MKKLEITKNECAILDYAGHICINDGAFYEDNNVLDADTAGENAAIDHARLFLNSIQTYQECELLPSELLKQNKELREALEDLHGKVEIVSGPAYKDSGMYAKIQEVLRTTKP